MPIKKVPIIDINTGNIIKDFEQFKEKNTMTVNKGNWSGEEVKITINRKQKTVYIHDLDMYLKFKRKFDEFYDDVYDVFWRFKDEKEYNSLGMAVKMTRSWQVTCDCTDLSRSHPNMYVAAVQLACNVI